MPVALFHLLGIIQFSKHILDREIICHSSAPPPILILSLFSSLLGTSRAVRAYLRDLVGESELVIGMQG